MGKGRKGETSAYFLDGRVREGIDYAMVPGEVMRSEAYRCIPDYARSWLFALALGFRGRNNGDLSLTQKIAAERGCYSEWRNRASRVILDRVGLIEQTRVGRIQAGQGVAALYALGWRQIDASDKYDTPTVIALRAPNRWATFRKPDDWREQVREIEHKARGGKRKSLGEFLKTAHPPRGAQAATHVGRTKGKSRYPRGAQESTFPATHGGSPSKRSGSTALGQQLANIRLADCIAVARAHPNLDAPALAERCKTDEATAHRALQAIQAGVAA